MLENKKDFIKRYFPDNIIGIEWTSINLDESDLSIIDVLRNMNLLYPTNSKIRFAVDSGNYALGVLCRTKLVEPYNGIFLIITSDTVDTRIVSTDYIILNISSGRIVSDAHLNQLSKEINAYLISNYYNHIDKFNELFVKFIYDESELYQDY